jgi:uncharacterized protein (TIGR03437 family)
MSSRLSNTLNAFFLVLSLAGAAKCQSVVQTLAGGSLAISPHSIAVDRNGAIYVSGNGRVYRVEATSITPFAGTVTPGFGGDSGDPLNAQLNTPLGLAVDTSGSLYIADSANHRIRKVTGGRISTVAGTGSGGFAGDGGPAVEAQLHTPSAVAIDAAGNLYILDKGNKRIRKVAINGTISTIAGSGVLRGDGVPAVQVQLDLNFDADIAAAADGSVFLSDGNRIFKISTDGLITTVTGTGTAGYNGDGRVALTAALQSPYGLAVDAGGSLFIADRYRVRRVANGLAIGTITTVAGTGQPGFNGDGLAAVDTQLSPWDVAVDQSGDVYFTDRENRRIRRITQVIKNLPLIRSDRGILNGATFTPGIAAGSWVSVFGENLAPVAAPGRSWRDVEIVNGVLPIALDGVSVRINNRPAAVAFIGPAQLNVQAPDDDALGVVPVEVTTSAGTVRTTAELRKFAPGLFMATERYVAAVHPDGTLVGRPAAIPGSRSAKAGDIVMLFGTGFGPAVPPQPAGRLVTVAPLAHAVAIRIGGVPAPHTFAGLVGPGLYQFNVHVPDLTAGDHEVVIEIEGVSTQPNARIAVDTNP